MTPPPPPELQQTQAQEGLGPREPTTVRQTQSFEGVREPVTNAFPSTESGAPGQSSTSLTPTPLFSFPTPSQSTSIPNVHPNPLRDVRMGERQRLLPPPEIRTPAPTQPPSTATPLFSSPRPNPLRDVQMGERQRPSQPPLEAATSRWPLAPIPSTSELVGLSCNAHARRTHPQPPPVLHGLH